MTRGVDVFWVPPEVETYIPVTVDSIEKAAFKIVHIKDKRQADELIALIEKSEQTVDGKRIRIKISTGNKSYSFDSNGVGVSSTGEAVRIELSKLRKVLCE